MRGPILGNTGGKGRGIVRDSTLVVDAMVIVFDGGLGAYMAVTHIIDG